MMVFRILVLVAVAALAFSAANPRVDPRQTPPVRVNAG
jgi:hypothetical protein